MATPGARYVLGPQRPTPSVPELVADLPGDGHVVAISAGWRWGEIEQPKVLSDLGVDVLHLPLYKWFDQIRRADLDVHRAHHARQHRIVEAKKLYRLRLVAALDAVRKLDDIELAEPDLVDDARRAAMAHVQQIDRHFIDTVDEVHAGGDFAEPWRDGVAAKGHGHATAALEGAKAVLVAGGHVGVLYTRMRFFGLHEALHDALNAGTALLAWSAGAMALSDRVVLFDDDTPHGFRHPELFGRGFKLMPGAVFLPHAADRLALDDGARVRRLANRFARPCIGLQPGAALRWDGVRWVSEGVTDAAFELGDDGVVRACEGA